jgi:hypothetical protein
MAENLYRSKVLMENWFEDRSNHKNGCHQFYKVSKEDQSFKSTLKQEEFNATNQNWLQFQDIKPASTFETMYQQEFKKPKEQVRTAEVTPFFLKKGVFEKDTKARDEYRETWTKGAHLFSREYPGARKD